MGIFFTEGMFDNQGYYATEYKNYKLDYVYDSKKKALRSIIGNRCNGKLKEWSEYQSNINEYDTAIIIHKKYESKLKTLKINLHTVRFRGRFEGNEKKYGKSIVDTPVIDVETDTAINFIEKYNIPIKIEGSDSNPGERNKILKFAINTFKEELQSIKKEYPIKNSISSETDDDKDDFIDGVKDQVIIGSYDLYKFTNTPRDDEKQEEFWKYSREFEKNVNSKLSKYDCKIKASGDWDDGFYYLKVTK